MGTEDRINEHKEHLNKSEETSSNEKKTGATIRDALEELIKFDANVEESRKTILNEILKSISSLEGEYGKRLTELEKDIKGLKEDHGKKTNFIATNEDLEKIKDIAEVVNSIPAEKLKNFSEIRIESLEIEKLREKIENIKETTAELKRGESSYITNNATAKKKILEISSKIEKMGRDGDEITSDSLENIDLTLRLAKFLSEENVAPVRGTINISGNFSEQLEEFSALISDKLKPFQREILYQKGINLLKKREYKGAKKCFRELTIIYPNLKEAWLNRGVASGGLRDFPDEIACYRIALQIDKNYKKAHHNYKIAERKIKKKSGGVT